MLPQDMMRHVLGEALNIGAVLTWGPSYYFQKQFFEGRVNRLSTASQILRYDVEVSGFPSSHNGHVVLLGLTSQDYPGTKMLEDWPTWNLPILEWARSQGAVVGYAHSGRGLSVKTDKLPNYEMPGFDGIGANEYIVDVVHKAVDFISAADTPYVFELNIWYHTLNSGFRTTISGETDFPCLSGERVGLGRSYVQIDGDLNFGAWIKGIREGRSYVSDGKGHLMDFKVNGLAVGTDGSEIKLGQPGAVKVTATVSARLAEQAIESIRGRPFDEPPYWEIERARIGQSREVPVELVVNGFPRATRNIVADGRMTKVEFDVSIERSSWIALHILPSAHTNPIFVTVGGKPVRASRRSAEWLLKAVDQCWSQKSPNISTGEREAAAAAYDRAREVYRQILAESDID
ncbi:MAG: CehA/McbA family metallohydrolase [Acidobacteriota bacterium]